MFRLIRIRASNPYTVADTVYDSLCVGRGPQNELCPQDRLVSTSHARFFVRGNALMLTDLDSRNGTEVNGHRLRPFQELELKSGDLVDIAGRLSFRVEVDPQSPFPNISVESDADDDASDGILRVLALPEGLTPMLDPGRLLQLNQLIYRLTAPVLQRSGPRWLDRLAAATARLLKVAEVQVLRFGDDGELRTIHPTSPGAPPNPHVIEECGRRRQAISADIAAGNLGEEHGSDPNQTFEISSTARLVIPVTCGYIETERGPWGMLYATAEDITGRRAFDDQDVWLLHALCRTLGHLLPYVSFSQVLDDQGARYRALFEAARELAVVGASPMLGATLEALPRLADDTRPVYWLAAPECEPERWATLLHRLGPRAEGPFVTLDASQHRGARFHAMLDDAINRALGGDLFIMRLDGLDDDDLAHLLDSLDQGWTRRSRLSVSAALPPEQMRTRSDDHAALFEALDVFAVRVPRLDERREDIVDIAAALARDLEPTVDEHFTYDALTLLGEHPCADDMHGLRQRVEAALRTHAERPIVQDTLSARMPDVDPPTLPEFAPDPTRRLERGFHPLAPDSPASVAAGPMVRALVRSGLLSDD